MTHTENLIELFTQKVFRIPDYQRGYAWEERQLSELWDDLDEISISNGVLKQHYTGTIFLEEFNPLPEEEWLGSKFYHIVDGQQRLTTIAILIFEMLKATENGYCERRKDELFEIFIAKKNLRETSEIYKFSHMDTNQNNKYLLRNIFENNKIVLETDCQNVYSKNLKYAKEYFFQRIKKLNNEQRELLFRKIIYALIFDIRPVEKDLDVQAVFETMNNRGKPLTTLEKLKNRLIYLTEKLDDEPAARKLLRDKINDAWGKIYSSLSQGLDHVLDEDVFLSAHLSLYKDPHGNVFSEKSAEEKVFQMFCNKPEKYNEESISYQKIEDYIISLSDLAPIWYKIHYSTDLVKKILLLNSTKEIKIFLAALFKNTANSENEREFVLKLLERLLFRNSVPGMWCTNVEYDASHKAREFYNGEIKIPDLNHFLNDLIKEPISQQSMINVFKNLFSYERGGKGFHRWWGLKYFLFEYEEKLRKEYNETNDKISFAVFNNTQIEHIMPQAWWDFWKDEMEDFTKTINEEKKEYARKVLLNTLGNLTILGPKNQYLKHNSWNYKKPCFSTGSYNEIEVSKFDKWNYKSIQQRGEKMLKFLCEKAQDDFTLDDDTIRQILFDADYIIKRIYE
jgi:uncharacterized protein with ParB-like and HNH nuclease domain